MTNSVHEYVESQLASVGWAAISLEQRKSRPRMIAGSAGRSSPPGLNWKAGKSRSWIQKKRSRQSRNPLQMRMRQSRRGQSQSRN